MSRRIVFTGGLSGGHTFPLIAVARALKDLSKGESDIEFLFIGSRGVFEEAAMQQEGIPMKYIWIAKWRRYFSFLNFLDIFKFPIACLQALWHLFLFMPDVVFAKGGAVSVPVVLAAWVFRIPVMLHDSDAVAGRANRMTARFAKRIAIAYEYARQFFPAEKVVVTGNPVRGEILEGSPDRARTVHALRSDLPVLLVVGGSLGARTLNDALSRILPELLAKHIQVIHITGAKNLDLAVEAAGKQGIKAGYDGYYAIPFLQGRDFADCLAVADLVLSRAGAGSIAELAALKKPTILVPLATAANDEQRMNAYEVAENGGAIVIEEQNLGEHLLFEKILELLTSQEVRQSMSEKIHMFYRGDAAQVIARGIITLLR